MGDCSEGSPIVHNNVLYLVQTKRERYDCQVGSWTEIIALVTATISLGVPLILAQ